MILRFIKWLEETLKSRSKQPWARFDTAGVEDGAVRYDMTWNAAFLDNLRNAGFTGHNEQEVVENFFLGSMIIPRMDGLSDDAVSEDSLAAPVMTSETHRFKS